MASFLTSDEDNYMSGLISSRRFLKFEDFEINEFLQEGGYGKVYSATRKSDGKKVAMKFFGYTRQKPDVEEIRKEVALMIRLDKGAKALSWKKFHCLTLLHEYCHSWQTATLSSLFPWLCKI